MKLSLYYKGSARSGNYGHAGIPGHQGGSAARKAFANISDIFEYAHEHSPYARHHIPDVEIDSTSQRLADTGSRAGRTGGQIFIGLESSAKVKKLLESGELNDETADGLMTVIHEYLHEQSPHIGVLNKPEERQIEEGLTEYFAREAVKKIYDIKNIKHRPYDNNVNGLIHMFSHDELVSLANKDDNTRRLTVELLACA